HRIHPVDRCTWHIIRQTNFVDIFHISGALYRCTHRVAVVLTNDNNRKFLKHRPVESIVQRTLTYCPITHETNIDIICSKIFLGKSYTRSQRDLSTNATVSTLHAMLFGEEVHRTAFTFGASCSLTKKLSHTGIGRHACSQRLRVTTLRADEGTLV